MVNLFGLPPKSHPRETLNQRHSETHHKRILPSSCPVAMQSSFGWHVTHVNVFLPPFLLSSLRKNLLKSKDFYFQHEKPLAINKNWIFTFVVETKFRLILTKKCDGPLWTSHQCSPVGFLFFEEKDLELQTLNWSNIFTLQGKKMEFS